MYVHTYVCLLFMNGLIRVMPKAIHMYVHHDRKPVCIARFSESRALMRIQAVAHDETSKVAADEQFAASGWTSSKLVFVVSSTRGHRVAESFAGK
jgi:hypothetical protein